MKYLSPLAILLVIISGFFTLLSTTYAAAAGDRIDMSVSPIRDEFTVTGSTAMTRTLQYSNNSDKPYIIYVTVEDCVPSGNYGTPICKLATGSGVNPEFSSTWIKVSERNFTVPPHTTKTITYTVNTPATAAPGGHYGAIFFNNPDANAAAANTVGMIRRIGMLYMIQIPGNIIVDPSIGAILVDGPGGAAAGGVTDTFGGLTSAPDGFWDMVRRNWQGAPMWGDIETELNPFWEKPLLTEVPFAVTLQVPVKNDGNIHIRPTGKVYLYDDNGEQLQKVGKESIVDENGVYVGESVVDYLPINDERGSVLPGTERTFQIQWLGFGYEERDPTTGKLGIKFETPGTYYSRVTEENTQFIYPWERLSIRKTNKVITAKVEFVYNDVTTGKNVTKTMEVPLTIQYAYIAKTINYGILLLLAFIIFCAWFFIRKRDRRIAVLEDENDELEDEITVLERAKKSIVEKKKTVPVAAKKPKVETKTEVKKPVAKKTPAKPAVKKVATKKAPVKTEDKA